MLKSLALAALLHDSSVSSSKLEIDGREVRVTFTLSIEDLATVVDLSREPGGLLKPDRYRAHAKQLFIYLQDRFTVLSNGEPCTAELIGGALPEDASVPVSSLKRPIGLVLRFSSPTPVQSLRISCTAFHDRVLRPVHFAEFPDGTSRILEPGRSEAVWEVRGSGPGPGGEFLWLGMKHILTGWDHLLFLAALLVAATCLTETLKIVTAFTVAHSITIALVALRVIALPGALVEPLIAASLVYVSIENLTGNGARHRGKVVFLFGLVHGMGFGGELLERRLAHPVWALLGFNAGVELGQVAVICTLFPFLALARRRPRVYTHVVARSASALAAGCGLVWFFIRVS